MIPENIKNLISKQFYPRDGQIGCLGDILRTMEGGILRTFWGPIIAHKVNA